MICLYEANPFSVFIIVRHQVQLWFMCAYFETVFDATHTRIYSNTRLRI